MPVRRNLYPKEQRELLLMVMAYDDMIVNGTKKLKNTVQNRI